MPEPTMAIFTNEKGKGYLFAFSWTQAGTVFSSLTNPKKDMNRKK